MNWWGRHWRSVLGAVAFVGGVVVAIVAAVRAADPATGSAEIGVWMVVLSSALNLTSVWLFAQNGRPDPTHAEASVSGLVRLAYRTESLSRAAEAARYASSTDMRVSLTEMSAQLNYVAQDLLASVEDWTSFNAAADRKVKELNTLAAQGAPGVDVTSTGSDEEVG